jgi:hypothetical protein
VIDPGDWRRSRRVAIVALLASAVIALAIKWLAG